MKRVLIILAAVMIFALPALAKEHYIIDYGMTIDIPDRYTVYRYGHDTEGSKKSVDEINAMLAENDNILVALDYENKRGFIVFRAFDYKDTDLNLKTATNAEREEFVSFQKSALGESLKSYSGTITTPDVEFHKFRCVGSLESVQYATVIYGHEICMSMIGGYDIITEEEVMEGDQIIRSVWFDSSLQQRRNRINADKIGEQREKEIAEKTIKKERASALLVFGIIVLIAGLAVAFLVMRKKRREKHHEVRSASCRACGGALTPTGCCTVCGKWRA